MENKKQASCDEIRINHKMYCGHDYWECSLTFCCRTFATMKASKCFMTPSRNFLLQTAGNFYQISALYKDLIQFKSGPVVEEVLKLSTQVKVQITSKIYTYVKVEVLH